MNKQQYQDRDFAKLLVDSIYGMEIKKLPIVISSRQYQYFVEEYNKRGKIYGKNY